MRLRTRRTLQLAGSALALSAALTGCSALDGILGGAPQDVERDDEGRPTEEKEIDIFALQVGDCLTEAAFTGGETDVAPVVPCEQPHPYEVYHEFELEDGEFPGTDAIEGPATEQCSAAFTEFVGLPFEESTLKITWFEPTQESWDSADDRLVQCIVTDPAGDVEGSLEGAGR